MKKKEKSYKEDCILMYGNKVMTTTTTIIITITTNKQREVSKIHKGKQQLLLLQPTTTSEKQKHYNEKELENCEQNIFNKILLYSRKNYNYHSGTSFGFNFKQPAFQLLLAS